MKDFLAEMISERTKANPDFSAMVEAALNRRELLRALAAERRAACGIAVPSSRRKR